MYPLTESKFYVNAIGSHLHSLWLFTFSDLKTILIPKLVFGTFYALNIS